MIAINFDINLGKATLEGNFHVTLGGICVKHAMQRGILSTNSAFALGPRKTAENLHRTGRS
jgi:hypothetical protein